MRKIFLLLLVFVFVFPLAAGNQADLEYLISALPARHKDFFNSSTRQEFEEYVSTLTEVEGLSDMEFYYLLSSLCAFANDSHTGVVMQNTPSSLMLLPFRLIRFSDGVFVYAASSKHSALLGSKLIGINGYSLPALEDMSKRLLPHDNEVFLKSQLVANLIYPDFLKALGVITSYNKGILFTFEKEGVFSSVVIHPVSLSIENGSNYQMVFKALPKTFQNGYFQHFDISEEAYFVQYNACQDSPEKTVLEFIKDVREKLEEKKYAKVIVDLRYNAGGNSALLEPLISYLCYYGAEVFVLIGPSTFSSAIMNALSLKEHCKAALVGQESGGRVNGYEELGYCLLPSGRYSLFYSTEFFSLTEEYQGVLTPDVTIATSFSDFLALKDREVDYCLR